MDRPVSRTKANVLAVQMSSIGFALVALVAAMVGCGGGSDSPPQGTDASAADAAPVFDDGGIRLDSGTSVALDGSAPPADAMVKPPDAAGSIPCSCDDGLSCTDDRCDDNGACQHITRPGFCTVGGQCVQNGSKNGSACQVCDATASQTAWTPIVGGCVINGQCMKNGERSSNGCQICDPARSATTWSAVAAACTIGGRCLLAGEYDSTRCNLCDPAKSTSAWTPATSDCQIDGQCFQNGDKHPSASCSSVLCDSTTSNSAWTVKGDECLIGSTCTKANARESTGCQACIPSQSKVAWSPARYDCQIANRCYQDGDRHPNAACQTVVCDSNVSKAAWTVKGQECLIADQCYQSGNKTAQGCQECNPDQSKTTWSAAAFDCQIAGGCYSNGQAHPSSTCSTVVCNGAQSTTQWTVSGDECLIGNTCYGPGDRSVGGCEMCNPTLSKSTWSVASDVCRIGGQCYPPGASHPSASCQGTVCDPTLSNTAWSVKGNECLIGSTCLAPGAQDATGCGSCNPATSKTGYTPVANVCLVNGTCYQNGAAHPSGTCQTVTCNASANSSDWTVTGSECVIGNQCVAMGASDPTGCFICDPTTSKTRWTMAASCSKIVVAALNEAHSGNMGGIAGADALCQAQASAEGFPGTWRAFLSSSSQNVRDLITGVAATSIPVVTNKGVQLFTNWESIFSSTATWSSSTLLYTFKGVAVDETSAVSPTWSDADGWHGSTATGQVATATTCSDWTSTVGSGAASEWDFRRMVSYVETKSCSITHAVACVQIP